MNYPKLIGSGHAYVKQFKNLVYIHMCMLCLMQIM